MRSSRLALTVTAFALLSALTACSGDSDSDPESGPTRQDVPEQFEMACTVQVDVTGTAQASWQGKGSSTDASEVVMYQSSDGKNRISVYAGNDEVPTSANVTVDGATYTTTDPEIGLDVAEDGTSATVDADTTGTTGAGPHLAATFTCHDASKDKAKGKGKRAKG